MNLSIQDGRAELWQWDTGVRLVMDEACEAVNLSEDTFGVTVDVTAAEDGKTWVAAVPDEMLQKPGDLICYAVQSTATGTITAAYRSFRVNRRPKPAGYVATPTEARTWQELDDKKIDAPQTAAVGEVLTVEEVDAEGKPKKWKTAPGIRGEKGDTGPAGPKGDTGPVGPKGADGKDGAGMDVTGAKVGQIAKITAVDSTGKPTAWEPVNMPSVPNDYELVFQETVTEDVGTYSRDTDKDGNPFSLTDVMVIIFTKPFAESPNSAGRAIGFLPITKWGGNAVLGISNTIKSGGNEVGCYDVAYVKMINGYQICDRYYRSQNATNVFGTMQERTGAGETGVQFHCDATKIMEISRPQGNITCVKIVGYTNPLVSAGTIIALYKKKGT